MRRWVFFAISLICIGLATTAIYLKSTRDNRSVEIIHTVSYSNVAVFYLLESKRSGLTRKFVPDPAKHVEALLAAGTSKPTVSVTPFSNALIAMTHNPDLVIIGGSGLNGLSLVSSVGSTLDDLTGKKIGTARGDSLEVFAYEAMRPRKYSFVYFTDPFVLVEAAKKREIDAATHVEPFATELITTAGMVRVLRSSQLWGDHPDAVLLTTRQIVEKYPDQLRELIGLLMLAEKEIKSDPMAAAKKVANFYNMTPMQLQQILGLQQPEIDIRKYEPFFYSRLQTLKEMNYIDEIPDTRKLFDWRFLN